jgi:type IV pilus assembly protein PilV
MSRRPLARRGRRGFTIVEVLVATLMLTVGVLGLAGVSALALRQTNSAERRNVAALVSQSRMERYRSLNCAAIDAALPYSGTTRGVSEQVTALATSPSTRTIRGRFTYTFRNMPATVIDDTTTILCP